MSQTLRRMVTSVCAIAIVSVVLVACGGQSAAPTSPPATVPATTEPAATVPAAASPEATAAETAVASPPPGGPVVATPVAASMATPVGATPLATPLAATAARTAEECASYLAWRSDREVQANLEHVALWPGIVAEAEKAAAGETFDTAAMTEAFAQIKETAPLLRTSDDEFTTGGLGRLAGRTMGLASRVAGDMAEGGTQEEIASELTDLKAAIADYEAAVAAADAQCGVTP